MGGRTADRTYSIGVIEKMHAIVLSVADRPKTAAEISVGLSIDPKTTYRIIRNLTSKGYLRQQSDKKYRIGYLFLTLSETVFDDDELKRAATEELTVLARTLRETAFVNIRHDRHVVCLERVSGPQPISLSVQIGTRRPLISGAAGRLLLSFSPPALIESVLEDSEGDQTESDLSALWSEIAAIRENGYALSRSERTAGVGAIAVPVCDQLGNVIAAMSIGGPEERVLGQGVDKAIEAMKKSATRLEASLASPPLIGTSARLENRSGDTESAAVIDEAAVTPDMKKRDRIGTL